MKHRWGWIVILIIIAISISDKYYSGRRVIRIEIFTAKGLSKEINGPIILITDKNALKQVSTIIRFRRKILKN